MSKPLLAQVLLFINQRFRATQKDGFGFAAWDPVKKVPLIEKHVDPEEFTGPGEFPASINDAGWLGSHAYFSDYASSALWSEHTAGGPLIAHGRTSTGDICIENTHPFNKRGFTLAHNGIVDWDGPAMPLDTTCDSEHLLNCYAHGNGAAHYSNFISGWFATLCITPDGLLKVAKCDATPLYFAWSRVWETYVFATDPIDLGLLGIRFKAGFTGPLLLEPFIEITLDGNLQAEPAVQFDPPEKVAALREQANKALGVTVTTAVRKDTRTDQERADDAAWDRDFEDNMRAMHEMESESELAGAGVHLPRGQGVNLEDMNERQRREDIEGQL